MKGSRSARQLCNELHGTSYLSNQASVLAVLWRVTQIGRAYNGAESDAGAVPDTTLLATFQGLEDHETPVECAVVHDPSS